MLHQLISPDPPELLSSLAMFQKGLLVNHRCLQGLLSLVYRNISNSAKMLWTQHSLIVENCLIRRFFAAEAEKASTLNSVPPDGHQQDDQPLVPPGVIYVLDCELADQIVVAVRKNQADPNVPVLESNPGIGLVTQRLLQAGVRQVLAVERVKEFLPYVKRLQSQVGTDVLKIFHWDYTSVWAGGINPICNYQDLENSVAALIPCKRPSDGPPLSVIAVLSVRKENAFLAYLCRSFSAQIGFFALGHPEWFLVISPLMYRKLLMTRMEKKNHVSLASPVAVVLELLFDIHLCDELPARKFTPKFSERKDRSSKFVPDVPSDMRCLVRMTPRKNVYDIILPSEMDMFSRFVKQIVSRRMQRLITRMEQLVPHCSVRLLSAGHTMSEWTFDQSPLGLLHIFKEMKTWPEYESSPMKQHLTESSIGLLDQDASHET